MSKRVFVDSTVFMAAIISGTGRAQELIVSGLTNTDEITLYFSDYVLLETERNLWKKRPDVIHIFRFLRDQITNISNPSAALVQQAAAIVVEKDAAIVAGAASASAHYLATYDQKHLLAKRDEIKAAFGIITATPDEIMSAAQP